MLRVSDLNPMRTAFLSQDPPQAGCEGEREWVGEMRERDRDIERKSNNVSESTASSKGTRENGGWEATQHCYPRAVECILPPVVGNTTQE